MVRILISDGAAVGIGLAFDELESGLDGAAERWASNTINSFSFELPHGLEKCSSYKKLELQRCELQRLFVGRFSKDLKILFELQRFELWKLIVRIFSRDLKILLELANVRITEIRIFEVFCWEISRDLKILLELTKVRITRVRIRQSLLYIEEVAFNRGLR